VNEERADHSSRGVLSTVVRRCVQSRNLVNEEVIARVGLHRSKQYSCGCTLDSTLPWLNWEITQLRYETETISNHVYTIQWKNRRTCFWIR